MHEGMNDLRKIFPIVGIAFFILLGIVLLAYLYSRPRTGAIVLPGGVTYLGQSPSATPIPRAATLFTADASVPWSPKNGAKYPYTFSIPETLTLVPFLTEEFDAYAITWNNAPKEANVLIGIEDLSRDEKRTPYVTKSKKEYIQSFWSKQYNLTGVKTIEPFTNRKGLNGYKVKFQTTGGVSPFDDVFLEVPKKPNLVIHLSNAILDPTVFEKIVESVGWLD